MKKPLHFKDEIRQAFITYALVPALLLVLFLVVSFFAISFWGSYTKLKKENQVLSSLLEHSIDNYIDKVQEISCQTLKNQTYSSLKKFALEQAIRGSFTVLDNNCAVVLEESLPHSFRLAQFSPEETWGTLGRIIKEPQKIHIEVTKDYSTVHQNELLIGKAIQPEMSNIIEGYIIFSIAENEILDKTNMISSNFVITNQFGKSLSTSSRYFLNPLGKLDNRYRYNVNWYVSENNLIYRQPICGGLLVVYTMSNISQLQTTMLSMLVMVFALLLLVSTGLVVTASKIAAQKTKIIDEIVAAHVEVENGVFDNRLFIDSNVEFQTIAEAYNRMLDKIIALIEENKKEAQASCISELKQLEMQFNPHFLFNTLESIKFLIKLDPETAQDTLVHLSNILRYSISTASSLVSLIDDIDYIENYLFILKARFKKNFNYTIQIEPEVRTVSVPKLIVQPLIENAVKHGFETKNHIDITITAKREHDKLIIVVADDGDGMTEDELIKIRGYISAKNNTTLHSGLHNVQRRIQLLFGENYGLTIVSCKQQGTVVTLVMPFEHAGDIYA